MAYCSQDDIIAEINSADLIPFLDDGNTGNLDTAMLAKIIDRETAKVNGYIASLFVTPINPVPALLRSACTTFVCEALYRRRLTPDEKNPFHSEAESLRSILTAIGKGEQPLDQGVSRAFAQGAVIQLPIAMNTNSL